jgi:hypothetical protein
VNDNTTEAITGAIRMYFKATNPVILEAGNQNVKANGRMTSEGVAAVGNWLVKVDILKNLSRLIACSPTGICHNRPSEEIFLPDTF